MSKRILCGLVSLLLWTAPAFAQQIVNTELPAAAALGDSMSNPTAPASGAFMAAWDGSVWKRVKFGSAGTASDQVWTVQGIASMTPLKVDGGSAAATTFLTVRLSDGTSYVTPGTDYTHDAALTMSTSAGPLFGGRASAAAPTDVSADNDFVGGWFLRNGAQVTQLSAAGTLVTATSTSLNVNCTGGCSGGTQYAEDAAHVSGNSGTLALGVRADTPASLAGTDGDYTGMIFDNTNRLWVRCGAGCGGVATASLVGESNVSAGAFTQPFTGLDQVQIVRPYANIEDQTRGLAAVTDGSSTSAIAAAGSGIKHYITSIVCSNSSATAVTVDIRDGTAGSVLMTVPCPVGGAVMSFPVPLGGFTANTAVAVDPSASATTITVTLLGFKSKI